MKPKRRYTTTSTTNFLKFGDEYLFVKRAMDKSVDAGRLNGIGGKTETGEDYLTCAIRETEEETGYVVSADDCRLAGVVKLEGGYEDDWVMCFFVIEVDTKEIPKGFFTDEGEFMWIHKGDLLAMDDEMVDDLQYSWQLIVGGKKPFFMTAVLNDDEKIVKYMLK